MRYFLLLGFVFSSWAQLPGRLEPHTVSYKPLCEGGVGTNCLLIRDASGRVSLGNTDLGPVTVAAPPLRLAMAAGGSYTPTGLIYTSTVQSANPGDANENTLWTYDLPAYTLGITGRSLKLVLDLACASNTNGKTIRVKYSQAGTTTTLLDSATVDATQNNVGYQAVVELSNTSAQLQVVTATQRTGTKTQVKAPFIAQLDTTSAITFFVTAISATSTAGDITFRRASIELTSGPPADCGVPYLLRFDGDSLTAGQNSTESATAAYGNDYPTVALRDLGYSCPKYDLNRGIGGTTVASLASRWDIEAPFFTDPTRPKKIAVIEIGVDDLFYGGTGAAEYAALTSLVAAYHAAHTRVVLVTILPTTKTGVDPGYETERQAYNAAILANTGGADGIADPGGDSAIGCPSCSDDTTYFCPDKLHMNNAGYARKAGIVAPVIATVAAMPAL